jgi:hypothetical protein
MMLNGNHVMKCEVMITILAGNQHVSDDKQGSIKPESKNAI